MNHASAMRGAGLLIIEHAVRQYVGGNGATLFRCRMKPSHQRQRLRRLYVETQVGHGKSVGNRRQSSVGFRRSFFQQHACRDERRARQQDIGKYWRAGPREAPLGLSMLDIMQKCRSAGLGNIRIPLQVPFRTEVWPGITRLRCAHIEIMACSRHHRGTGRSIVGDVPSRIEQLVPGDGDPPSLCLNVGRGRRLPPFSCAVSNIMQCRIEPGLTDIVESPNIFDSVEGRSGIAKLCRPVINVVVRGIHASLSNVLITIQIPVAIPDRLRFKRADIVAAHLLSHRPDRSTFLPPKLNIMFERRHPSCDDVSVEIGISRYTEPRPRITPSRDPVLDKVGCWITICLDKCRVARRIPFGVEERIAGHRRYPQLHYAIGHGRYGSLFRSPMKRIMQQSALLRIADIRMMIEIAAGAE